MSSKELAYYISQYDYELFNAVNVVSTSILLGVVFSLARHQETLERLSNPRRPQQTANKRLMRKSIAVHVRYISLYISLPSSAKQQREMINFYVA